jgi:hypothetical protein
MTETEVNAEASKKIMELIQEAIRLAPSAGLYLKITVTEAKAK